MEKPEKSSNITEDHQKRIFRIEQKIDELASSFDDVKSFMRTSIDDAKANETRHRGHEQSDKFNLDLLTYVGDRVINLERQAQEKKKIHDEGTSEKNQSQPQCYHGRMHTFGVLYSKKMSDVSGTFASAQGLFCVSCGYYFYFNKTE